MVKFGLFSKYRAMFSAFVADPEAKIAMLYLRTAEFVENKSCGIYEIVSKTGRKSYKIYSSKKEFEKYILKNKDKKSSDKNPVFENKEYKIFTNTKIKKLSNEEINRYLKEQSEK